MHSKTSSFVNVSIEVDPNNVVHTSPDKFAEDEKTFIIKYPKASAPTDSMAMEASPLIFASFPLFNMSTALNIVIGRVTAILLLKFKTPDTHIAPKATWDNPSPIKENLFNTSVIPIKEEQRAIKTPTIKALRTKECWRYISKIPIKSDIYLTTFLFQPELITFPFVQILSKIYILSLCSKKCFFPQK